jgi:hypothetical protein
MVADDIVPDIGQFLSETGQVTILMVPSKAECVKYSRAVKIHVSITRHYNLRMERRYRARAAAAATERAACIRGAALCTAV